MGESECRDANFQLRVCVHALCLNVSITKKTKTKKTQKRAARRCCDTVPMLVSAGLCVRAVFLTPFVYMCSISLERSRGLMGTCTNSSMRALRAATPTLSSPVCILLSLQTGMQALRGKADCAAPETMHLVLLSPRRDRSGISDINTNYLYFNFKVHRVPLHLPFTILPPAYTSILNIFFCQNFSHHFQF